MAVPVTVFVLFVTEATQFCVTAGSTHAVIAATAAGDGTGAGAGEGGSEGGAAHLLPSFF